MNDGPHLYDDRPSDEDIASLAGLPFAQAVTALTDRTTGWSSTRKSAMLEYLRAQHTRITLARRYSHPAELAAALDPGYVITPALDVISRSVERAIREPRRNLLVTMPPQEGKSNLCAVVAPIRALQLNPDTRIILATYADALAEDHSRAARAMIAQSGTGATDPLTGAALADRLGLALSPERSSVSGWRVKGAKGGLIAVGLGSSITGRPADLMIIDDPFKNMQEADSAAHRKRVLDWFRSVAMTRLAPNASVILIQTRWHQEDLAGAVLAAESEVEPRFRSWRHINIPAVAEEGIPDELGREPGQAMVSARGRTADEFAATRRGVGERVWFALYQGVPAPPDGGLFSRTWFNLHRLPAAPDHPVAVQVGIDPAESGDRDEAGVVAGALYADGTIAMTHDRSDLFTSDQWSKAAVRLAVEIGAREIAFEAYSSATTYTNVVKGAWKVLHEEATAKHRAGEELTELDRKFLAPTMPFAIHPWREKGDDVARSSFLRQETETGRTRMVGASMAVMEEQAATWQAGQHQPDRVSAVVVAHSRLARLRGGGGGLASPTRPSPTPRNTGWLARRVGG